MRGRGGGQDRRERSICAGDRGSSPARRGHADRTELSVIEIVVGAATVRIPPGIDAATLQTPA